MSPSRLALALFFALALVLTFLPAAVAQLPQAGDTTSPPTLGVGHDYLGSPAETVNPANGSVSIRIPVRISPGRQLTLPLAIAYDSAGAFYYGTSLGANPPHYATTTNVPFSQGGWSYTLPLMTFSEVDWIHPNPGGRPYGCSEDINFVFQDPTGNRHNLGLLAVQPGPGGQYCGYTISPRGEGPIQATIPSNIIDPPVTVTDGNGTVYSFSNPYLALPTSITDRNGNTISVSGTASSATVTDTLGRTALSVATFGASPDSINVDGLASPYQVSWTTASGSFSINTNNLNYPYSANCPTSISGSAKAVSQIVLPNGQKYAFSYDSTYGMLNKITYASGGYVRYVWGLNPLAEAGSWSSSTQSYTCQYDFPVITDRYVSFDGSTEVLHQHFAYSTTWETGSFPNTLYWIDKQTTVTTTDLVRGTSFNTVYTYSPVGIPLPPMASGSGSAPVFTEEIPVEQCIEYYDSSGSGGTPPSPCPNVNPGGKLLRTEIKSWYSADPRTLGSVQTVLDNGQSSLTVNCFNLSTEQLTETDSYDLGTSAITPPTCSNNVPSGTVAGSLLRKTTNTYASFTAHIVDLPSTVIAYDGSNNKAGETDYTYDNPVGSTTSGIVQHSGGCNCGNLTSEARWINSSGSTLTTTFTNDDTGQRLTMNDPRGNQTSYSYADSYSSGAPPGPTNAFLTQITYPNSGVAHVEKFSYAYSTGELTSSTDQNNQVTNYKYVDSLARLSETDFPDGGVTTYTYTDAPNAVSIETKHQIDSSRWTDAFTLYNGLGLPIAQSTANGEATPWNRVDSCYDGTSRVLLSSYPYQVTSATVAPNCTSGVGDTITYDALGRTTQISHSDGNTILSAYTGRASQVQDEGNGTRRVQRISQTDGLGRLTSVCEVTGASQLGNGGTPAACGQDIAATGFLTSYAYDALSDLLSVTQGTLNTRSFNYDFLSRLTSATNPESGTISYTYDANSNLATKTAPAPNQTGSATVTTSYTYDALNRLTQESYSDGTTPTAYYLYDETSNSGVTETNTVGRLTTEGSYANNTWLASSKFSYDAMGRVILNPQQTPTSWFGWQPSYTYDLAGDMTSSTNGLSVTFNYTVNAAAHITAITSSLSDANHPGTLFSSAHYNSAGSLLSATLGGSVSETRTYDTRLRLASITDGSNYSLTIPSSGGYAPDSDILSANDSVNGNWTYSYDDFDRLSGSNQNNGQSVYSYVYDRFGNRWQQNGQYSMQLSFSGANNRMDGYSYDAAGNLLNDGSHQYFYDAENRVIQVDGTIGNCSTATACYVYDANGQRVEKTTSSGTVNYLYDLGGHQITEINSSGGWNRGEVYAGGRHIATYVNGTTNFTHPDWLGTERVRTTAAGASCETIISLPFGDGETVSGSCGDPSPMHFTGKQRDNETASHSGGTDGLDFFGARYYASNFSRFMTPDWSSVPIPVPFSNLANPQSLNLYSYVANNPLNGTDPNGHCWKWIQGLCNAVQKVYYGVFTEWGFSTHAQASVLQKQQTEARRQWLINNNVVTPDSKGNSIDWSTASSKQVNSGFESATETLAMAAFAFTYLHDKELLLKNPRINDIRKMSTQDIIKSLNEIGSKDGEWMKIRPDGTVINGNTRLLVLEERGLDINNLGLRPEVIMKQAMWDDDLVLPPHPPTEKPPDNQ